MKLKLALFAGCFAIGLLLSFVSPEIGFCLTLLGAVATDNVRRQQTCGTHRNEVLLAGGVNAFGLTFLCTDANGYGTGTPVATSRFLGMVVTQVDNSAGADGDEAVEVVEDGKVLVDFPDNDLVQADVGAIVYMVNNNDFTKTAGATTPRAGKLTKLVSSSQAWVSLEPYAD